MPLKAVSRTITARPTIPTDAIWSFVDTVLFKMMQVMTQFNLTPVCFKVYDRLAIPKAVPGTFRHIAIATDMFAVHATIIHNRLAEPLNRSCPSQIIAFLANRSAMDGNAVRQSVREDCAQTLAEGQDAELLILLLDDVKMYDSMSAFTSAWSLKSLGAPELMQQCFAENQHLNSFHVSTDTEPIVSLLCFMAL